MLPRTRRRSALRALLSGAIVVVMICAGLLVLVMASMTSPQMTDPETGGPTDFGALMAGLGMLVLLALPWYRKAPLVLMVAGAVSALVLRMDPFVLAVGLTVWIVRCRQRWQWAVGGIGLALIVLNTVLHLHGLSQWPDAEYRRTGQVLVVAMTVLCVGLVLGISLWTRQKRSTKHAESQAQSAQQNSELLSGELARQREREDLAREVHDTLAGRLSGLSLQVGSLEQTAQRGDEDQLDEALRTTRSYADQALADLRVLLTSLRESGASATIPAKTPTGVPDLQDLLDDAAAAGLEVRPYILLDGYSSAPPALQRAILRITQEALTNALRHSEDRVVHLSISGDQQRGVRLGFSNRSTTGPGFSGGAGTGLIGIRERAHLLGGTAEVRTEGGEFAVSVFLPWPSAEPAR
ncbi:sensor histidine kinase [Nesterenkonia muleiensis]|uniref:sensor histidine kinase n=1 Tax=Nesterenkonia muleiensis TaxID=2282648 RepID=UPI000E737759|nr:histidine kinase [Nesterenkonia muleiensis]